MQESEVSRAVLADKLIEARVRTILDPLASEMPLAGGLDIAVAGGKVALSGTVSDGNELESAVESVKNVDNKVQRFTRIYDA